MSVTNFTTMTTASAQVTVFIVQKVVILCQHYSTESKPSKSSLDASESSPNTAANCLRVSSEHMCMRAPTHTRRPSGILMVYAVLTLAVKVWLCGMTHIADKPTSKALSSKFSQKLLAYMRVYTVINSIHMQHIQTSPTV